MRFIYASVIDEYICLNWRKNCRLLIFFICAFAFGIIIGLFLGGGGIYADGIFADSINFTILIFGGKVSFFQLVFRSFFINLQYFILIFIFSLSFYLFPLNFLFVIYKGYVFGAAVIVFTQTLGLHGFSNILILVLPQQIILLSSLTLYISYSREATKCFTQCKSFTGIGLQAKNCGVFFLLSLSNIAVQVLFLYVIIKPFNILI